MAPKRKSGAQTQLVKELGGCGAQLRLKVQGNGYVSLPPCLLGVGHEGDHVATRENLGVERDWRSYTLKWH